MAEKRQLEFFLLRYVPDAVKDEFVNVGLVMIEPEGDGGFADVRFIQDWRRVWCLDPAADVEILQALEREIRNQLGEVKDREALLKRLQDSFSNLIQVSAMKACLAEDPAAEMQVLAKMYFESPRQERRRELSARQQIVRRMRESFEAAGVWEVLRKEIAVAKYTHKGDPLKIDFGYRPNGVVKLFHGVALGSGVDMAKLLAFAYPQIVAGIEKDEGASTSLTAVVEDSLDRNHEEVAFALATLQGAGIAVSRVGEMAAIAEHARVELRL